jgi:hypothetical protein
MNIYNWLRFNVCKFKFKLMIVLKKLRRYIVDF